MRYQKYCYLAVQVMKVVVVSLAGVGLLSGCSSQLRTTIVSGSEAQKVQLAQVESEQLQQEPVRATVEPDQNQNLGAGPQLDIPVELPAIPVIRQSSVPEIAATPETAGASPIGLEQASENQGGQRAASLMPSSETTKEAETAVQQSQVTQLPVIGIPSVSYEPELPALPTLRHDDTDSTREATATIVDDVSAQSASSVRESLMDSQTEHGTVSQPAVDPFATDQFDGGTTSDELVEQPKIVAQVAPAEADEMHSQTSSTEQEPMQVAKVMPQEARDVEMVNETLEAALSDVYFDYDQFFIREDATVLLKANAQLLTDKLAGKRIVIEGHCDERGTQSYNMVLGEKRAKAVKHFLQALGVPEENLEIVSFGKDKPFCLDQTETCRQENRRGHFVIK